MPHGGCTLFADQAEVAETRQVERHDPAEGAEHDRVGQKWDGTEPSEGEPAAVVGTLSLPMARCRRVGVPSFLTRFYGFVS